MAVGYKIGSIAPPSPPHINPSPSPPPADMSCDPDDGQCNCKELEDGSGLQDRINSRQCDGCYSDWYDSLFNYIDEDTLECTGKKSRGNTFLPQKPALLDSHHSNSLTNTSPSLPECQCHPKTSPLPLSQNFNATLKE
jgi:hypothetical protein